MIDNILVLCIGNVCRSPMAEGLLKRALPGKTVHSAGVGALVGRPAEPLAVEIMRELDIDISAHRARGLNAAMVKEADLILTMDSEQKRYLETQYPASKGKVFRIGEFRKFDVPDPYRRGIDDFRRSYRLIADGVNDVVGRIAQLT